MISLADVYHVVAATVPLYVAMILAYISVKWWKLFTPDQCSGINKFVAKFSIPLLTFQVIAANDPYKMSIKLMFADFLQKVLAIFLLAVITRVSSRGRGLNWIITGLSLSTLPNTLILGIPLLKAMYGEDAKMLLAQIVVLQSIIWYNLLLFLFELNVVREAAKKVPPLDNPGEVETPQEAQSKELEEEANTERARKTKTKDILLIVLRKLVMNPNTHATVIGIIWACIHFRWNVNLPEIVKNSILILSDGGLGMAMFSLGLFMASQKSLIACGTRKAMLAMGMKFFMGPALMAASSFSIQLRGTVFKVAIVQAALPQGIVPFVFAKEYGLHPDVLSTGVIFGMLISLPIALAYYFLLAI